MLQALHVRNLAIVEDLAVEFREGLNVITGETGAGKSILINALDLALGERFDRKMIRAGEDQCSVEAALRLSAPDEVNRALAEAGLDPCADGELLLKRVASASGASRNFINGGSATVQTLKRIGDLLVDMHGPYDHQSLLSPAYQMDLLDAFGEHQRLREEYARPFRRSTELQQQRQALQGDEATVAQQLDLLAYQVREIEEAQLAEGSEEELLREHRTVANAQAILEKSDAAVRALTEQEGSAFDGLVAAQKALSELRAVLPETAEWQREAESIAAQVQELSRAIRVHAESVEGNPRRLQFLDDHLALLSRLKRKYGRGVPEILAFLDTARKRKSDLETRDVRIRDIEKELAETRNQVEAAGRRLSEARTKSAAVLARAVTRELHELGFAHGTFAVDLRPIEPSPSGMDEVEFGFAPNVGEPMRPLRAIASSGEISRVMLASKAVLARQDRIPVLVFDEIDTNVGGAMASAVGAKLRAVAQSRQVLCITHLPQVAVYGGAHYVVFKEVAQNRTFTRIRPVSGPDRVEEIARMLGGRDSTSVALKHAAEMLRNV
jgi:DNA repair protein RecN (Recombination protein N)